jgi:hypothetical protein
MSKSIYSWTYACHSNTNDITSTIPNFVVFTLTVQLHQDDSSSTHYISSERLNQSRFRQSRIPSFT